MIIIYFKFFSLQNIEMYSKLSDQHDYKETNFSILISVYTGSFIGDTLFTSRIKNLK